MRKHEGTTSLNPYSNGTMYLITFQEQMDRYLSSLNPYSNGTMYLMNGNPLKKAPKKQGLNPYSNGTMYLIYAQAVVSHVYTAS